LTLAAPPDIMAFRRWFVEEFVREMAGEAPRPWPEYAALHIEAETTDGAPESAAVEVAADGTDGIPVLVLRGDIDLETAPEVRASLQRLRDGGATTIAIDAHAVDFLDSVGISVFIAARERLVNDGGGLIVRSPSRQVRRSLEIAGLSEMFHISLS
ncbi:MAG: anti-anti-sigma factor, partial [Acidimicrobiia bacterium]|nr:anti-anti-sigma factor [Acidimicrobiia bacterium]